MSFIIYFLSVHSATMPKVFPWIFNIFKGDVLVLEYCSVNTWDWVPLIQLLYLTF